MLEMLLLLRTHADAPNLLLCHELDQCALHYMNQESANSLAIVQALAHDFPDTCGRPSRRFTFSFDENADPGDPDSEGKLTIAFGDQVVEYTGADPSSLRAIIRPWVCQDWLAAAAETGSYTGLASLLLFVMPEEGLPDDDFSFLYAIPDHILAGMTRATTQLVRLASWRPLHKRLTTHIPLATWAVVFERLAADQKDSSFNARFFTPKQRLALGISTQ
jgi:hypothetical protein